ncbi:hypothetical protein C8J56DRAFT_1056677 [Mycena floridula]|nr:hypothetical protein C8J56DRAFT_1056677 [Mycena floridula]
MSLGTDVKDHHRSAAENACPIWAEDFEFTKPTPDRPYTGPKGEFEDSECTLEELLGGEHNMHLVKWTGDTSIPILDCHDHLMGVLCGRPDKKKWMPEVHDPFLDTMKEAHESYRAAAFKKLMEMECVQRISGYGSRSFQAFSKTMYQEYLDTLSGIIADPDNPGLKRNFEEKISCFAAATFNLGLQTVSFPHINTKNWVEGHCLIFVGGDHDHTKGGHIVLWDLGLVIEFPAGCSILLMSAALKHSNVKIQPGETRCSFVQYTAGGLVRWLENGYQSDASILERRDPLEMAAWEERCRNRVAVAVKHAQYQYYYDSAL